MAIISLIERHPIPKLIYDHKGVNYIYRDCRWYRIGFDGKMFKNDPPKRALIEWGFEREGE